MKQSIETVHRHKFRLVLGSIVFFVILLFGVVSKYREEEKYKWPMVHLHVSSSLNHNTSKNSFVTPCEANLPSFFSIASTTSTDKTKHKPHHYEIAYQSFLAPLRCNEMSFLEIGLGCGMQYGAGHSVPLWSKYLPLATISLFEWDYPCVVSFVDEDKGIFSSLSPADSNRLHFFTGDQSDPEALQKTAQVTGPYDVIVDDGGHTWLQQLVSLSILLYHVKPGGIYVLEDLATSFQEGYASGLRVSAVQFISQMQECLHAAPIGRENNLHQKISHKNIASACDLARLVESISCWEEICVFKRWNKNVDLEVHNT
jgi:hypothetical protein